MNHSALFNKTYNALFMIQKEKLNDLVWYGFNLITSTEDYVAQAIHLADLIQINSHKCFSITYERPLWSTDGKHVIWNTIC